MALIGQILKGIGWLAILVPPSICLVFIFYDRGIAMSGMIWLIISAASVPIGLLLLLIGFAFAGPKSEGKFGEPHS